MRTRWEISDGSCRIASINRSANLMSCSAVALVPGFQGGLGVEGEELRGRLHPRQVRQQHGEAGIVVGPKPRLRTAGGRDQKLAVRLESAQRQQDVGRRRLWLFGHRKVISRGARRLHAQPITPAEGFLGGLIARRHAGRWITVWRIRRRHIQTVAPAEGFLRGLVTAGMSAMAHGRRLVAVAAIKPLPRGQVHRLRLHRVAGAGGVIAARTIDAENDLARVVPVVPCHGRRWSGQSAGRSTAESQRSSGRRAPAAG